MLLRSVLVLSVLSAIAVQTSFAADPAEWPASRSASYFSPVALQTEDDTAPREVKSVGRAMLLSLMLPGLGESKNGHRKAAIFFMATEVTFWGIFAAHRIYSGWLADDYRTYARQHAGAPVAGQVKQYFVDIGNFQDIYEFNESKGVDRAFDVQYAETSEFTWQWDTDANRVRFKSMRVSSDRARNRATFYLTGIFLNHLSSAINVALAVRRWNTGLLSTSTFRLTTSAFTPTGYPDLRGALQITIPF